LTKNEGAIAEREKGEKTTPSTLRDLKTELLQLGGGGGGGGAILKNKRVVPPGPGDNQLWEQKALDALRTKGSWKKAKSNPGTGMVNEQKKEKRGSFIISLQRRRKVCGQEGNHRQKENKNEGQEQKPREKKTKANQEAIGKKSKTPRPSRPSKIEPGIRTEKKKRSQGNWKERVGVPNSHRNKQMKKKTGSKVFSE